MAGKRTPWLRWFRRKPRVIGLALSGGAIHGAAHIGVLQVLEREGISPQIVAGTSAGALVGAAYVAGVPLAEMGRLFAAARWPTLLTIAWRASPLGIFGTEPMETFICSHLGDRTFEDLPRPFAAVACDIMSGERVVLASGRLAPALRASAAIPGVFAPVEINGRLLVDGALVDNLPAGLVQEMGADYVIAVDLDSPCALKRRPANPIEMVVAATNVLINRAALPAPHQYHCLIRPDVAEYPIWDFNQTAALQARGREAAEEAIGRLRADLGLKGR